MRMKTLNLVISKAVSVMAETDEEFEEKRKRIISNVIYEELSSNYCNNSVNVAGNYETNEEMKERTLQQLGITAKNL